MQDERLSLSLPLRPDVLRRAGAMLLGLAESLDGCGAVTVDLKDAIDTTDTTDPPPPLATDPPPPLAAPVGVELDLARLPWDVRINPDSKEKLKTGARAGCWKYKRKLDAAFIAQVEAELRAALAVPVPAAPADPPLATDPPPPLATDPPPPLATDPPPPPVPVVGALDFPGIIQKVTALQNANRISPEQVQGVATTVGLASFTLLGTRPDLIPAVSLEIDKLCPPIQS